MNASRVLSKELKELDLWPIAFKLSTKLPWSEARIEKSISQYRVFLQLIKNGEYAVPTNDLDEVWHCHILDTRKYAKDCELIFWKLLHHDQYYGLRGEEDIQARDLSFETTRALFAEYGENLSVISAKKGSFWNRFQSKIASLQGRRAACCGGGQAACCGWGKAACCGGGQAACCGGSVNS